MRNATFAELLAQKCGLTEAQIKIAIGETFLKSRGTFTNPASVANREGLRDDQIWRD